MASARLIASVEAVKPAVSITAPGATAIPAGLTRTSRPLEPSEPAMVLALVQAVDQLCQWMLADGQLQAIVIPPDLSLTPHDLEVADWFEAPLAHLLDPVTVNAYGSQMPINQVASVTLALAAAGAGAFWSLGLPLPVHAIDARRAARLFEHDDRIEAHHLAVRARHVDARDGVRIPPIGFDQPQTFLTPYNPRWYAELWTAAGFRVESEMLAVEFSRDRKASTSYIQRRLQIGYNRAASLMERMEKEAILARAHEHFDAELEDWVGSVLLSVPVLITGEVGRTYDKGGISIEFMTCDDKACHPPEKVRLPFTVIPEPSRLKGTAFSALPRMMSSR